MRRSTYRPAGSHTPPGVAATIRSSASRFAASEGVTPRAVAHAASAGIPAWVVGEVTTIDRATTTVEVVSGAKGVDGGAVQVLGEHPDA